MSESGYRKSGLTAAWVKRAKPKDKPYKISDRDICTDLRGALITPKVTHRAAITTPMEAGGLLRTIDSYDGNYLTKIALQLLPHIFVRPGELRNAEWR